MKRCLSWLRPAAAPGAHRIELAPYTFWETRRGSGPPVVLIHGLGGSSDWWRYTTPALAERRTVAAVDLVGFGRNRFFLRRSSLPLRFDDIAALLIRWLESSFNEPVHLVGNSMGGQIAIHVASARPDLVRSLVLVSSTGIPFELHPGIHIENVMIPTGALSFARVLARDLFRSGPTAVALAFTRLLRDDARPRLRLLKMPVLLLWGERDPLVPMRYAQEMMALIPRGRLVPIAGAGHVPMWENPVQFNAALLGFLDEVEEGERSRSTGRAALIPSDGEENAPAGPSRSSPQTFSWGLTGWSEGIAHRESGRERDLVLVHGLGMSSAYFARFARAMFERGAGPIAPDLPGFGESANAPAAGAEQHARILAAWADRHGIRDVTWLGHSTGCHAVAHLAALRPDLVRRAVFLSPLWSGTRPLLRRLFFDLVVDAAREPFKLFPTVVRAYWRTGLARWGLTLRRYLPDLRRFGDLPQPFHLIAGGRDPLVDHTASRRIDRAARLDLPGAHAMHFSHPDETAAAVEEACAS